MIPAEIPCTMQKDQTSRNLGMQNSISWLVPFRARITEKGRIEIAFLPMKVPRGIPGFSERFEQYTEHDLGTEFNRVLCLPTAAGLHTQRPRSWDAHVEAVYNPCGTSSSSSRDVFWGPLVAGLVSSR